MKAAACIVAYNEHRYIAACLKQIPPWVKRIVVLESDLPWNGTPSDDAGLTKNAILGSGVPSVEHIRLNWRSEAIQRNWGLGLLYEYDWVLVLDADEFYSTEDWEKMRVFMEKMCGNREVPTVGAKSVKTYWKNTDYCLFPEDTHNPIVAVNPKVFVFHDKRSGGTSDGIYVIDITMHHLSWVKSDGEVWQKIHNWAHSNDFDKQSWYNDVWMKWTPEIAYEVHGLRPYGKEKDTVAMRGNLPDEIKMLLG